MKLIFFATCFALIPVSAFSQECGAQIDAANQNRILSAEEQLADIQQSASPDEPVESFESRNDLANEIAQMKTSEAQRKTSCNTATPLQAWEALPENAGLVVACGNDALYASAITDARHKGASLKMLLRWAEKESEQTSLPDEPLLPVGTEMIILRLIQRSYLDRETYVHIDGGFTQWAFRSCLKGHPIDQ